MLDRVSRDGLHETIRLVDTILEKNGSVPLVPVILFSHLLRQCTEERNLLTGKHLHCLIVGIGLETSLYLGSSLVHMFALCGGLQESIQGFSKLYRKNVYSWTALIEAHVELGDYKKAIQMFHEMQRIEMELDGYVFVAVLKACSMIAALDLGVEIHVCVIENGLDVDLFVCSALINMYAKCGHLHEAYLAFDRLSRRNVITWSALILGYVEYGDFQDALLLFQKMEMEGVEPNEVTYLCLLKACSSIAALEHGKHIHSHIITRGFQLDVFLGNTLLDMYGKCGSLGDALIVFNRMPKQDVVSWSVLIAVYAKHSNYEDALLLFQNMQEMMIMPNGVTYLSLISACSHAGLMEKGCQHFKDMIMLNGILPTLEHYNAVVDLLARSGHLKEAEDLLETLPFSADYVGWVSLLDSCRLDTKAVCQGKRCFDRVVTLKSQCTAGYVLMSNVYANAGLWNDVKELEELRQCANLWKKPAKAFIEIDNCVHDFIVGDTNHPQSDEIYAKIRTLNSQLRKEGCNVPEMDFENNMESHHVPLTDDDKEKHLCGHSEKLAIAFGLISTPQGTTIRVAKNLRVCADCHSAVKMISKIELREIVIVDAYRIHHFKDGVCCCRDEYYAYI